MHSWLCKCLNLVNGRAFDKQHIYTLCHHSSVQHSVNAKTTFSTKSYICKIKDKYLIKVLVEITNIPCFLVTVFACAMNRLRHRSYVLNFMRYLHSSMQLLSLGTSLKPRITHLRFCKTHCNDSDDMNFTNDREVWRDRRSKSETALFHVPQPRRVSTADVTTTALAQCWHLKAPLKGLFYPRNQT